MKIQLQDVKLGGVYKEHSGLLSAKPGVEPEPGAEVEPDDEHDGREPSPEFQLCSTLSSWYKPRQAANINGKYDEKLQDLSTKDETFRTNLRNIFLFYF